MPASNRILETQSHEQENKDLNNLLAAINTPAFKHQSPLHVLYSGTSADDSSQFHATKGPQGLAQYRPTEAEQLEKFSIQYQGQRIFSSHAHHKLFHDVFTTLTANRLCCREWLSCAAPELRLRVFVCLRILLRDVDFQKLFFSLNGVKCLSDHFHDVTSTYLTMPDGSYSKDMLKEMTNMFQKLSSVEEHRDWLVDCNVHKVLVLLLSASDVLILQCCLHALIGLCHSCRARQLIGQLNSIDMLLRIVQEFDAISRTLAASLLRSLCADPHSRETIKEYDGVRILLSQLHSNSVHLLYHVIWCLVQLCEDDGHCSAMMRHMGAIPLSLALLQEQRLASEQTTGRDAMVASAVGSELTQHTCQDLFEDKLQLKSACCAALMELVMNDSNTQQIVQANGVFILGSLTLPPKDLSNYKETRIKLLNTLQMSALRTLRFLFSIERNRRLFKHLFPSHLFEMFIDIGHYNKDLKAYSALIEKINCYSEEAILEIQENMQNVNQSRSPSHYINDFAVFELLGTGAFGSVYKVRHRAARQSFMAMKELNLQNFTMGKNASEIEHSVGEITNELRIMKQELRHQNIVRYHHTFEENNKLYIVMELIEGATLADHFTSLKEKKAYFEEQRIWNIFLQIILALRYLHKEKGIVHRDLTPNNIMLGDRDKVTITDFGLAKQKRADCSKMMSIVGTILYSCPEVVQSQPYGEKADIWALGCILYQMLMLQPPFFSNNILTLVKKIVGAEYTAIPEGIYSKRLCDTMQRCLESLPDNRPDVLELSASLSDLLLVCMDHLRVSQTSLQRKLDRERKRSLRYMVEANHNMHNYHHLILASKLHGHDLSECSPGRYSAQRIEEASVDEVAHPVQCSNRRSLACHLPHINSMPSSARYTHHQGIDLGVCLNDAYASSDTDSRESSAGSVRSADYPHPPQLSPGTVLHPPAARGSVERSGVDGDRLKSSIVNVPPAVQNSRDSGLGSSYPSMGCMSQMPKDHQLSASSCVLSMPNFSDSNSCPDLQHIHHSDTPTVGACGDRKHLNIRSKSSTRLAFLPSRVREISDPILQILHQLHKIIYITQLPPTLMPNKRRLMVERYKRTLFSKGSTAMNLKIELRKLVQGSREMIDMDLLPCDISGHALYSRDHDACVFDADNPVTGQYDPDYKNAGSTYEYLQTVIEDLLLESGYYDVSDDFKNKPI